MVTFHLRVRDLLRDGAGLTIHCMCLRKTRWTTETLGRFSPGWRVWQAVDSFQCGGCGRQGMVRDMDTREPVESYDVSRPRSPKAFKAIARKSTNEPAGTRRGAK